MNVPTTRELNKEKNDIRNNADAFLKSKEIEEENLTPGGYAFETTSPSSTRTGEGERERYNVKCLLKCMRCQYYLSNNIQCKLRTCYGLPYCHHHLKKARLVEIRPSLIVNPQTGQSIGKGLFAYDDRIPNARTNNTEIVFHKDDILFGYGGERILESNHEKRYPGENEDAAYAFNLGKNVMDDAACVRHYASFINHKPQSESNIDSFVITRESEERENCCRNNRRRGRGRRRNAPYQINNPMHAKRRIVFEAKRDIRNNEELTFDYRINNLENMPYQPPENLSRDRKFTFRKKRRDETNSNYLAEKERFHTILSNDVDHETNNDIWRSNFVVL